MPGLCPLSTKVVKYPLISFLLPLEERSHSYREDCSQTHCSTRTSLTKRISSALHILPVTVSHFYGPSNKNRKISFYLPRLEGFREGFQNPHWFSFWCAGLGTHSVITFPFPWQPAHDFVICFLLVSHAAFLLQHGILALLFIISSYLWNCDVISKCLFKD